VTTSHPQVRGGHKEEDQGMDEAPASRPTLRVIRGDATPEEIAAILAVVSARTAQADEPARRALQGGWTDRTAGMRPMPSPGPGAWRSANWMR
jgi:Acyl-CoA carboxylase epsilon subunit